MSVLEKRKYSFILLIVAVLSGYIAIKMFLPFLDEFEDQTQLIQVKKNELNGYHTLLKQEDELLNRFKTLSKQIQSEIPEQREESQFLTKIGEVAVNTNVYIERMNPQPFRDFEEFKELSVEIEMDANLGNLTRFLYEMRKASVVLVVDQLTLKPNSNGSALLRGHLVISTIFLKE